MCVCMYVYMRMCVYVCMYVCMRLYVWMYVCMYENLCVYVWMYVCIYVCMCVCMHVCMCVCINVCMLSPAVLGNKEMNAKADLALVLESTEGMYGDFVSNSSAYLDARGLRANSFSLNGIVIEDHSITANVMQLLGRYIHT